MVLPINPSKVAFEMSLYYMTLDRYKGDIIPEGFSSADEMILLFEKDKYSINCIYSEKPSKRPLSNWKNVSDWIFK